MVANEHDTLDPNGECIAIMDERNVAMQLLSMAWEQMPPKAR